MLTLTVWFLAMGSMFSRASVVQMDMVSCVVPQHSIVAALSGVPATQQTDTCAEYVILSPTVIFRVQAKKSEMLMVPGENVSFRTGKGKLYLRRDDEQGELEATVLCMRATNAPSDGCGMRSEERREQVRAARQREF